jgi:hypothetical protein
MNKIFCLQADSTSNYRFQVRNLISNITHTLFFIAMAYSSLHLVSQHF